MAKQTAVKNTVESRDVDAIMTDLRQIRDDLNNRFRRSSVTVETMMASMLAKELILLIGPRGEAKTSIVEALAGYISDGQHFSVGLAKSSTPDDILGGVDSQAYINEGTYRRNVDGFLPTATTFLLDEGFKSNNPTLQSLLRVLSERSFQGKSLPTLFGAIASNELPPELRGQKNGKSADLGPFEDSLLAFFDRFTHKVEVEPLPTGTKDWDDVVFGGCSDSVSSTRVTVDDIRTAQGAVDSVELPEHVKNSIRELSAALASGSAGSAVHVSTRSWRKVVRIIRAHALLDGRKSVTRSDLRWLEHALWTTPDQKAVIAEAIISVGSPETAEALMVEAKVKQYFEAFNDRRLYGNSQGEFAMSDARVSDLSSASAAEPFALWLKSQVNELQKLREQCDEQPEVDRVLKVVDGIRVKVVESMLTRLRSSL